MATNEMNAAPLFGICILGIGLAACSVSPTPLPSMFVCVNSPGWRFLSAPPEDEARLYERVGRRVGLSDYPGESRDHWLMSQRGELRLCRQQVDATNFCGSANVTFTLVDDQWQPQPGVTIPTCGLTP